MPATMIDGKEISAKVKWATKLDVADFKLKSGVTPGLATVLVGSDPASEVYVRNKRQTCEKLGIQSFHHDLSADITESDLLGIVDTLNKDKSVHGILVQLPLPSQINTEKVLNAVSPVKDVDGFHPVNLGNLFAGTPTLIPCTPHGIIKMLESINYDLKGKKAVVVGRSNIVGKPISMLLLQRHATVTMCHSRTVDLPGEVAKANLVVAAIGRAEFIKTEWIKEGAVVIDVGMNRDANKKLVGDVERSACERASFITPVPGGVGPMTIAMLMANTLRAAKLQTEN